MICWVNQLSPPQRKVLLGPDWKVLEGPDGALSFLSALRVVVGMVEMGPRMADVGVNKLMSQAAWVQICSPPLAVDPLPLKWNLVILPLTARLVYIIMCH